MRTHRKRTSAPAVRRLEDRQLLAGLSAVWVGQEGHDFVGPYPAVAPDGVQDVRIHIANIPEGTQIVSADLTGLGGGRWVVNQEGSIWRAVLKASSEPTSADLYFEPNQVETGRPFNLVLRLDDGTNADLWLDGGAADPNLRMPEASLSVDWIGQLGDDRTGPGIGVGPDGFVDVQLGLSGLAAGSEIDSITVTGPSGKTWQYGMNHAGYTNAELDRNSADPTVARLYLNPDRDLDGQTLTVEVAYASGKTDKAQVLAKTTNPDARAQSPPAPPPMRGGVISAWAGQSSSIGSTPGWASVSLSGLPSGLSVLGATLSDSTHESWVYRAEGQTPKTYYSDPYARPLNFQPLGGGKATVDFPPIRDERGATLTLRLTFSDGTMAVVPVASGSTDPGLLSAQPNRKSIIVAPGADLNSLASIYGKIELSPGEYDLSSPLVLSKSITITAPQGNATLVFSQPPTDPAWTAAIKIHSGNTTLDNFAVQFDGPVRWRADVDYGPAVIGTTDNLDPGQPDPKAGITLTRLNLGAPPASSQGEEAPRAIRMASALSGRIEGNTIRGGTTEFLHGPWTIAGNTYLGTMPGTWAWDVFAGHYTHDLQISDNVISPSADAGRTWRFLVLTGTDDDAQILRNNIRGIGPRDSDTASVNAPEIILTESYSLNFEGKPLRIAAGGSVLQIPTPPGGAPGSGSVVTILDGPHAGEWRRIAQAIDSNTYLLSDPLPTGDYTISIGNGFVHQNYQGNTIDIRGSSVAAGMVLVGSSFGTTVVGNRILGGGEAIRAAAFPTEHPSIWGWSHTPFVGAKFSGNTIEDALKGMTLTVSHGAPIKSNQGRTYFTAEVTDNRVVWSDSFAAANAASLPPGITLGELGSIDPDELHVHLAGNLVDVPSGIQAPNVRIVSATIDDVPLHDTQRPLPSVQPAAPRAVELLHDTGISSTDRVTRDGRIRVISLDPDVSFEYSLGSQGRFESIGNPSGFLPSGLRDGSNTVSVRAVDRRGRSGPSTTLQFTLDGTPPESSAPRLAPGSDTGASNDDGVTRSSILRFEASGSAGDSIELLRDGEIVAVGGAHELTDPGPVPEGKHRYTLRRTDVAGNSSESLPLTVFVDTTPPGPVTGLGASPDFLVRFSPTSPTDSYAYRVGDGAAISLGSSTSFTPQGLIWGVNRVEVYALDVAGNIGPAAVLTVDTRPPGPSRTPVATWIGQNSADHVGPNSLGQPDGFQDIQIALDGLPTDRVIVNAVVQGLGGSRWDSSGNSGSWRSRLVQIPGSAHADLYLQPDRLETGRPFQIDLDFSDGSTTQIWMTGGFADPSLRVAANGGSRDLGGSAVTRDVLVPQGTGSKHFATTPGGARRSLVLHALIRRNERVQARVALLRARGYTALMNRSR